MPDEIELKLSVPRAALRRVAELSWLRELASEPPKREKLVSVYFDSRKFKLRENGVSLRVRHIGRKRIQTIKASGGAARAFGREEWEREISGDKPKLGLAEDTPLEPLATKKLKRRLKPIFETKVDRVTMPIDAGDCQLELAIDRGRIRADGKTEPISEIELELKRGRPGGACEYRPAHRRIRSRRIRGANEGRARLCACGRRGCGSGPRGRHLARQVMVGRREFQGHRCIVPQALCSESGRGRQWRLGRRASNARRLAPSAGCNERIQRSIGRPRDRSNQG